MNDTENRRLSVVIPIYNSGRYLRECIDSVLKQTYTDLEIILVDDGSTGDEPKICDDYAKSDSRIKVIHQSNSGSVAARETGIRASSAPYITFIDSDDFIESDYYSRMMDPLLLHDADLIIAGYTLFDNERSEKISQGIADGIYSGESLRFFLTNMNCADAVYYTAGILPSNCLKIYRTALLKKESDKLPSTIRMGDDAGLTFPYILHCSSIIVDNTICGYHYRQIQGSISKTTDESLFTGASDLYDYLKPYYSATDDPEIITQLELYRAYLIQTALNAWMQGSIFSFPHRLSRIRKLASQTDFLNDLDNILTLNIPRPLRNQLACINSHEWIRFAFYWYRNHVATRVIRKIRS